LLRYIFNTISFNGVFEDLPCKPIDGFAHQFISNKIIHVSTSQVVTDMIANTSMIVSLNQKSQIVFRYAQKS